MITTLLFDLDDTICNTTECVEEAMMECYKKFSNYFPHVSHDEFMKADSEAFRELFHHDRIPVYRASIMIWFRIFKKLGLKQDVKMIYNMYKYLYQHVTNKIQLNDGFKEVWNYAQKNNMKIGILSNGAFLEKMERLLKLELCESNVSLLTSDLIGYDKPDQRAFRIILRSLNSRPSQSIFVGDTPSTDIFGAKRVGIMAVLFKRKNKQYADKDLVHCDYAITSHKEIIDIICKHNV